MDKLNVLISFNNKKRHLLTRTNGSKVEVTHCRKIWAIMARTRCMFFVVWCVCVCGCLGCA